MSRDIKIIGVAVVAGLALGWLFFSGGSPLGGTFNASSNPVFRFGLRAGNNQTQVIDSSGNLLTAVSSTANINAGSFQLDGGSQLGEFTCATSSWNPGSLASSSVDGISATSTDIALSGAAAGDLCVAGLSSATSTSARLNCNISSANTSTISLFNIGSAALDLATGTARVCYLGF